jgi:hypothetical protein
MRWRAKQAATSCEIAGRLKGTKVMKSIFPRQIHRQPLFFFVIGGYMYFYYGIPCELNVQDREESVLYCSTRCQKEG